MTSLRVALISSIALLGTVLAAPSFAYEGGAVSNGGSIKGTISVSDKGLQDEVLTVAKDKTYCGELPAEKFLVSATGGLQNAVVKIEGISQGKAFDAKAEFSMTNKQCRFVPHVGVVTKGGMMKVRNDDPLLHNSHFYLVQANSKKKNVINLALPKQGIEIGKSKILRKPGLLSVECDAHDFMQGWVWVLEHPYGAVTDSDGGFVLEDVPAGSYKLTIWHEALGEKTADVTVKAGKGATVDVSF